MSTNTETVNNKPRVAIITANYGSYDTPKSHSNVINKDLVDWYYFTDNENIKLLPFWNIITIKYHLNSELNTELNSLPNKIPNSNEITNNMMSAKYYKAQTHKIPELQLYNYYIWIDSSLFLRYNFINNIFKLLDKSYKLISFAHSVRNNIKDELNVCINMVKYQTQDLVHQYNTYINDGYPDDIGLFENTMMIKANDTQINEIFDLWWLHNLKYSYQDQLSFPYILWKSNYKPDYIINENVFKNVNYSYVVHRLLKKHNYDSVKK